MNIQPTPGVTSLAGTSRAQARGTDADRQSPAADAAANLTAAGAAEIEAGSKTEDRDADGRQLLDQQARDRAHRHSDEDDQADSQETGDKTASPPSGPDAEGPATHIDFEA